LNKRRTVITVEPAVSSYPHDTASILYDALNRVVAQPVFGSEQSVLQRMLGGHRCWKPDKRKDYKYKGSRNRVLVKKQVTTIGKSDSYRMLRNC
jgi:hypothetical protein